MFAAYHACGHGVVGGFVYQDECAQCGVFGIRHGIERLLQDDVQTAYVVCFQGVGSGYSAQGVYVPHIADAFDFGGGGEDEAFMDAVRVVIEGGKASTSYLQRRLRIGYGKAARLIEEMEERGIVGPANGSKARDVLVSSVDELGQ